MDDAYMNLHAQLYLLNIVLHHKVCWKLQQYEVNRLRLPAENNTNLWFAMQILLFGHTHTHPSEKTRMVLFNCSKARKKEHSLSFQITSSQVTEHHTNFCCYLKFSD